MISLAWRRSVRVLTCCRCFSTHEYSDRNRNTVAYILPTIQATEDVAAIYSASREVGDVCLISGTLGAGKSTFCRSYIRLACGDEELPVPSPTYTLLNTYEEEIADGPPVHHLDLYRLTDAAGQHRLQFQQLWSSGATLIEWPDRLQEKPACFFELSLSTCKKEDEENLRRFALADTLAVNQAEDEVEDSRWRVLEVRGHGVDVWRRHETGMQALDEEMEFIVVSPDSLHELETLRSRSAKDASGW